MELDTATHILNVAKKHFVQNGFAATRMQDIADEAGINKALLHYYYRSKDKLYDEIVKQQLSILAPRLAEALSGNLPFWDKIEKFVDTYISTLSEDPALPLFIMTELSQKKPSFIEELKKNNTLFPAIQKLISEMKLEMEAGRITTIPPFHLFLNIISLSVFPFIIKPLFTNLFEVPDTVFEVLMNERKSIIINFLKNALLPKE
jgi:TetR/AcrR family transcriptional regulator